MDVILERAEDGGFRLRREDGATWRCAIGRGGIRREKREGDGATPAGAWPIRCLLYRPDRGGPPETAIPASPIAKEDGWCDDPGDPAYNRPVRLPYPASHERMWREDSLYDLVVVLGQNDDPPVPGRGSAIFWHLARPDYGPTEGCLALSESDLRAAIKGLAPESRVIVPEALAED